MKTKHCPVDSWSLPTLLQAFWFQIHNLPLVTHLASQQSISPAPQRGLFHEWTHSAHFGDRLRTVAAHVCVSQGKTPPLHLRNTNRRNLLMSINMNMIKSEICTEKDIKGDEGWGQVSLKFCVYFGEESQYLFWGVINPPYRPPRGVQIFTQTTSFGTSRVMKVVGQVSSKSCI